MKKLSVFTVMIALALVSCKQDYTSNEESNTSVKKAKVVQLEPTAEAIPVYAAGKIQSLESMKLSFKTGGIIRTLHASPGEYVRQGQLLASLDLAEINAQVAQAKSNVEKLERDLNRFRKLYADSAATLQSVQDIETGLEVAQAGLQIAQFNQKYSQIIAPHSGKIQSKMSEENELVSPGQPIYTLGTTEGVSLNVGLADRDVVKLRLGDEATITFDAFPGEKAEAKVTEIAGEGHPVTGTFQVELTILNFPYELKPGFFARATIKPGEQKPYFKVPMHAIVEGLDQQVAVFIPSENKVRRVVLSPKHIGEDFFTVEAESSNELAVITDGASYLSEGDYFETINE